jgi:hypothetical protein
MCDRVEHFELGVEHLRGTPPRGPYNRVPPRHRSVIDADEVDRDAIAGIDALDASVERLQRADPRWPVARLDHDLVADSERAIDERAGDDGPRTTRGEHAVDPQPRTTTIL